MTKQAHTPGHRVVAIAHCAAGNEHVGQMWCETATFSEDEPMQRALDWFAGVHSAYRLELTRAQQP